MRTGNPGPEAPSLVEAVHTALRARRWRLAVAESCTGGLLLKRLTDLPGSSDVILGGVVAYADAVKLKLLGVDPALLRAEGAVSPGVARTMAAGIAEALAAEVGVSVTGIAGPSGGSDAKPVGTVWFGCSVQGESVVESVVFSGDREAIRAQAADRALRILLERIGGDPPAP